MESTIFPDKLAALCVIGWIRQAERPFQIATYQGVRTAIVHLGHVPCDFLAWEHLNWECATFDRGVYGETGLATSSPLHVGGRELGLFLVTTQRNMPRIVRWEGVRAEGRFELRYAVPDEAVSDELRGGGSLVVAVDDEALATLALPAAPEGELRTLALDTRAYAGRDVTLTLTLSGPGASVVLDGRFEP
jgi:hypothetical protein